MFNILILSCHIIAFSRLEEDILLYECIACMQVQLDILITNFIYTELCNNIKCIKRKSCLKVITLVHCCKQVGKGAEPEGEGN